MQWLHHVVVRQIEENEFVNYGTVYVINWLIQSRRNSFEETVAKMYTVSPVNSNNNMCVIYWNFVVFWNFVWQYLWINWGARICRHRVKVCTCLHNHTFCQLLWQHTQALTIDEQPLQVCYCGCRNVESVFYASSAIARVNDFVCQSFVKLL